MNGTDAEKMAANLFMALNNKTEGEASSSSGSSESSSSSGDESSSSSSTPDNASKPTPPHPLWKQDQMGYFIVVTCAENEAKFYKHRFARGSIGKCVLFRERWITPNEFQAISGRQSSKDWKRSIRLQGRCLKDYISEGLFEEHPKTCTCGICQGEDRDLRRQEGVMALAAKRRRLSQAGVELSYGGFGQTVSRPRHPSLSETEGVDVESDGVAEGDGKLQPDSVMKNNRSMNHGKSQRVWSPSGEMAQEVSSNEDDYQPSKMIHPLPDMDIPPDSIIDASDFLPRRSNRGTHRKHTGYRTELGVFPRKPSEWDVDEVSEFMCAHGFAEYAESFKECDINGQSMFLLKEHHLLEKFEMKLGPTLRLLDTISRLGHPPISPPGHD